MICYLLPGKSLLLPILGPFDLWKLLSANIFILSSMLDDVSKLPVDQDNTAWHHKRHTKPKHVSDVST